MSSQQTEPSELGVVTAVAAGVLAILGTVVHGAGVVSQVYEMYSYAAFVPDEPILFTGNVLIILMLGPGAVLMFLHRVAGRWLVVGGASTALVVFGYWIAKIRLRITELASYEADTEGFLLMGMTFLGMASLVAITTLVLALVPPTGRWIRRSNR